VVVRQQQWQEYEEHVVVAAVENGVCCAWQVCRTWGQHTRQVGEPRCGRTSSRQVAVEKERPRYEPKPTNQTATIIKPVVHAAQQPRMKVEPRQERCTPCCRVLRVMTMRAGAERVQTVRTGGAYAREMLHKEPIQTHPNGTRQSAMRA